MIPNSLGRLQEAGQYRRPGEYAGWLGKTHNPVTTIVDKKDVKDNPYWRNCVDSELTFQLDGMASPEGLAGDRLSGRVSVLEKIDAARKKFKDLKTHCCVLVLYNVDKPLVGLDWEHVYGAMLGNRQVGSFGRIACWSLYPTKNLGAFGDGGAAFWPLLTPILRTREYLYLGKRIPAPVAVGAKLWNGIPKLFMLVDAWQSPERPKPLTPSAVWYVSCLPGHWKSAF